jgi:sugar phosphate isomerase/epimerase
MKIDNVGIERLCVFGMPPVEFIDLAATLDCRYIGIGIEAMRYYNPHNYPDWSFRNNRLLQRETKTALRNCGVEISLFEGFGIRPDMNVRDLNADLDIVVELGCKRVNLVSVDRDLQRTIDAFAAVAELARERGIEVVSEVGVRPLSNLQQAHAVLQQVAQDNFKLLLDTMHFFRLGSELQDLAAIDPNTIGYVQLCDAPLNPTGSSYLHEALHERMVPGSGELPLQELLALMPEDLIVSVEVPQRSLAEAGMGPRERVALSIDATRHLLPQRSTHNV